MLIYVFPLQIIKYAVKCLAEDLGYGLHKEWNLILSKSIPRALLHDEEGDFDFARKNFENFDQAG